MKLSERYHISEALKEALSNGCGPQSAFIDYVPDCILFKSICAACCIHDIDYEFGITIHDKEAADRTFLNNMVRLIDAGYSWKWLRKLRRKIAHGYYDAVKKYGGPAFWDKSTPKLTVKLQKEYNNLNQRINNG